MSDKGYRLPGGHVRPVYQLHPLVKGRPYCFVPATLNTGETRHQVKPSPQTGGGLARSIQEKLQVVSSGPNVNVPDFLLDSKSRMWRKDWWKSREFPGWLVELGISMNYHSSLHRKSF